MDRIGKKKYILIMSFIGVTLAVYIAFKYILPVVAPFVIAVLFAIMIRKPVCFLEKKLKLKPIIATMLVVSLISLVLILGTGYVFGMIIKEIRLFVSNYDIYQESVNGTICEVCEKFDKSMGFKSGSSEKYVTLYLDKGTRAIEEKVVPMVVEKSLGIIVWIVTGIGILVIIFISTVLISKDMEDIVNKINESKFTNEFQFIKRSLSGVGGIYLKTQGIIMLVTALVCVIGFLIIKSPYGLILGLLTGLLDALPIFGAGTVLIPFSLYYVFVGDYFKAAVIFTMYCICYFARQYLEPKLMGGKLGVSAIMMLLSTYVGFVLFSVGGFILGPIGYILIKDIMREISTNL